MGHVTHARALQWTHNEAQRLLEAKPSVVLCQQVLTSICLIPDVILLKLVPCPLPSSHLQQCDLNLLRTCFIFCNPSIIMISMSSTVATEITGLIFRTEPGTW